MSTYSLGKLEPVPVLIIHCLQLVIPLLEKCEVVVRSEPWVVVSDSPMSTTYHMKALDLDEMVEVKPSWKDVAIATVMF
ncbi:hypothetical protein FCV25MIE_28333 [Fagus crenata]